MADNLVQQEQGIVEPLAAVVDPEQQEFSLTQSADTKPSVDEVSPALAQAEEVSPLAGDMELNPAEVSPSPADLISDEQDAPTIQVVHDATVSEATKLRTPEPTIPAKPAAHRSTPSEPAQPHADASAAPAQPRSALHSGAMLQADQAELGMGPEKTAPSQNIAVAVPLAAETTVALSAHRSANEANQVPEGVSSSSVYVPKVSEPVSPSEITQALREPEQAPLSPKPAVIPATVSRRRAQIQEVAAEQRPQTVVANQKSPRPAKSQARVGNPPKPASSAAAPAAEPGAAEAQELFVPLDNVDRSPAAWRERLAEAIRVESENEEKQSSPPAAKPAKAPQNVSRDPHSPAVKPDASGRVDRPAAPMRRISSQPGRLPESARRFLNPLVGFDTRDIPIHEGPAVSRLLAAGGADAIAADDSILLGPGHEAGAPKTLGVLAHELTHIARGRATRFVPPVARPATARESAVSLADTTDEEGLAQQVESRVKQAAVGQAAKGEDATSATGITRAATRLAFPRSASSPARQSEVSPDSRGPEEAWGGLPAPWDPMPEWVSAPPVTQPALVSSANTSVMPPVSASVAAAVAAPTTESAAPARAESGRSLPEAEAPREGGGHAHPAEGKHAGPDLDVLARQVYTIVRRRLAADRRREFMQ